LFDKSIKDVRVFSAHLESNCLNLCADQRLLLFDNSPDA